MASRRIDLLRTLRFARAIKIRSGRTSTMTMMTTTTTTTTTAMVAGTATTRAQMPVRWFSSPPSSPFDSHPAPPRLPPEEQAEFERLLREAAESVAAAELADSVRQATADNQKTDGQQAAEAAETTPEAASAAPAGTSGNPIEGVWRGAPPEFEGDRNPVTGEVGGPKNEPLRWGSGGDWSFNGRVTDF